MLNHPYHILLYEHCLIPEMWSGNRTHSPVALMGSEVSITVVGTEVSPCLVITTVALSAPSPTVYSSVEKERMGTGEDMGAELGQNGGR